MTLTTHIRIIQPYSVPEIHTELCRIIGAENPIVHHGPDKYSEQGAWCMRNRAGQGFLAIVDVNYGPDAPLHRNSYELDSPEEFSIDVSLDTTYGYTADNGASCSDLHAWIIQELGAWLDDRGLDWYWLNEYTGEWHHRFDDPLTELGSPERGRVLPSGVPA
jgi:hypothetical protein